MLKIFLFRCFMALQQCSQEQQHGHQPVPRFGQESFLHHQQQHENPRGTRREGQFDAFQCWNCELQQIDTKRHKIIHVRIQEHMISTSYLAAQYLKQANFNKKVYIVGSTGISRELDAIGIKHTGVGPDVLNGSMMALVKEQFKPDPEIGAVIVGFDEHFSFPKMLKAASYLNDPSTIFIGTNTDERFPMPNFVVPGTGSMVRSIETCAERKAVVMGKPENWLCDIFFKEEIHRDSKKFLMIGDRLNTDILFGKNNNFQTLLVETGVHKIDKVEEIIEQLNKGEADPEMEKQVPDFYISSLGDLFNNYD